MLNLKLFLVNFSNEDTNLLTLYTNFNKQLLTYKYNKTYPQSLCCFFLILKSRLRLRTRNPTICDAYSAS